VRTGSFFPSLLERRRRIDRALFAVVMEAYVHGVSTRSVDDLVKALGADSGIFRTATWNITTDRAVRCVPLPGIGGRMQQRLLADACAYARI
jgi:hypothetical protein